MKKAVLMTLAALGLLALAAGPAAFFDMRGGGASSWRYSIPYSPVRALSHEYREVRQMPIREGRWFTRDEEGSSGSGWPS